MPVPPVESSDLCLHATSLAFWEGDGPLTRVVQGSTLNYSVVQCCTVLYSVLQCLNLKLIFTVDTCCRRETITWVKHKLLNFKKEGNDEIPFIFSCNAGNILETQPPAKEFIYV